MLAMTKELAQSRIQIILQQIESLESEMIDLALQYEIEVYSDKGRLLLEDDRWTGKQRGEWYSSTDSCS